MENEKLVEQYIAQVNNAIQSAENGKTKLDPLQFSIQGMSSKKNRVFLNELLSLDLIPINYLEVGTWKGSTFISALYNNKINRAIAIDNFSQFEGTLAAFNKNCELSKIVNFEFMNSDCFNLSEKEKNTICDINIYFYDGDHTHEDQLKALTYYIDCLQEVFIFIVDDWNHPPVKTGTRQGISDTGLKIHQEWELPANFNGDRANWWNGLYVAVCEKVK